MNLAPQVLGNIDAIKGLNPKRFWEIFAGLNEYPRDSKKETPALDAVKAWAKSFSFNCPQDGVGNICVHVPASEGVIAEPVIVQGHIDMVCEKTPDSKHDFTNDPIELVKQDGYIKAKDTSLGADNLLGVAAAMAIAEDPDSVHPAMQILITVDEEGDFTGANGLDVEKLGLTGRDFLNTDTESPSTLITASAGYRDISGKLLVERESIEETEGDYYELELTGFAGGHSGLNIDDGRGSANMSLVRILQELSQKGIQIISIDGGTQANSISAFASAEIFIPSKVGIGEIESLLEGKKIELRKTLKDKDKNPNKNIEIKLKELDKEVMKTIGAITHDTKGKIFTALESIPDGVISRSEAEETQGEPEESSGVGYVRVGNRKKPKEQDTAELKICVRSYVDKQSVEIAAGVQSTLEKIGFTSEFLSSGGSWVGDPNSPLSKKVLETFQELDGEPGKIARVNGGLEIEGIIKKLRETLGGEFDAVSFGTTILDQHSTEERIPTDKAEKFYNHLSGVLEKLAA